MLLVETGTFPELSESQGREEEEGRGGGGTSFLCWSVLKITGLKKKQTPVNGLRVE